MPTNALGGGPFHGPSTCVGSGQEGKRAGRTDRERLRDARPLRAPPAPASGGPTSRPEASGDQVCTAGVSPRPFSWTSQPARRARRRADGRIRKAPWGRSPDPCAQEATPAEGQGSTLLAQLFARLPACSSVPVHAFVLDPEQHPGSECGNEKRNINAYGHLQAKRRPECGRPPSAPPLLAQPQAPGPEGGGGQRPPPPSVAGGPRPETPFLPWTSVVPRPPRAGLGRSPACCLALGASCLP